METAASTIRPRRPSMSSASATMRRLGVAVREASRSRRAITRSSTAGLRSQARVKAAAVERLIPAQQWIRHRGVASQIRPKASSWTTCASSGQW